MRLAAITFAERLHVTCSSGRAAQADVIFATSLMSLADLRALLPPGLQSTPSVLLMHENQVAYPRRTRDAVAADRDVHFGLTNLTSMLSATRILWNSAWNQSSFIDGMREVLRHVPDGAPGSALETIMDRSDIWWPPIDVAPFDSFARRTRNVGSDQRDRAIRIVWPHRWEHDKGPDVLLRLARRYTAAWNLRWTILGEQFSRIPPAFEAFREAFAHRIDQFGFVDDRRAYLEHLAACDWVLSTARHDFFGIAVVEALHMGCLPWLPQRLSYRELLPPSCTGLHPGQPLDHVDAYREDLATHLHDTRVDVAVRRLDDIMHDVARKQSHRKSSS